MATSALSKRYTTNKPSKARQQMLETVLSHLLEFVTSGRRYQSQNPYTIPEVQAAMRALGKE